MFSECLTNVGKNEKTYHTCRSNEASIPMFAHTGFTIRMYSRFKDIVDVYIWIRLEVKKRSVVFGGELAQRSRPMNYVDWRHKCYNRITGVHQEGCKPHLKVIRIHKAPCLLSILICVKDLSSIASNEPNHLCSWCVFVHAALRNPFRIQGTEKIRNIEATSRIAPRAKTITLRQVNHVNHGLCLLQPKDCGAVAKLSGGT